MPIGRNIAQRSVVFIGQFFNDALEIGVMPAVLSVEYDRPVLSGQPLETTIICQFLQHRRNLPHELAQTPACSMTRRRTSKSLT